jgi:shikimate kinase
MQERRPIYESIADIVIDVNAKSEQAIVAEILGAVA